MNMRMAPSSGGDVRSDSSRRLELGIVVGLTDIDSFSSVPCDFYELLMFNGQLDQVDLEAVSRTVRGLSRPVKFLHVQEFISHDDSVTLLDLASGDEGVRSKSVGVVRSSRELASHLGGLPIVIHPGGISRRPADRRRLSANLVSSLAELGPDRLLLENMPWYYWLKGVGRMVSNVCVTCRDMSGFCDLVEGFVLDSCHGYLSRPEGDNEFCKSFMDSFREKVVHIHVSDAMAPDKEGLQIGDGEIDFKFLTTANVPVLVEVWNGHENQGEGFRTGIERLRVLIQDVRLEPRR